MQLETIITIEIMIKKIVSIAVVIVSSEIAIASTASFLKKMLFCKLRLILPFESIAVL